MVPRIQSKNRPDSRGTVHNQDKVVGIGFHKPDIYANYQEPGSYGNLDHLGVFHQNYNYCIGGRLCFCVVQLGRGSNKLGH